MNGKKVRSENLDRPPPLCRCSRPGCDSRSQRRRVTRCSCPSSFATTTLENNLRLQVTTKHSEYCTRPDTNLASSSCSTHSPRATLSTSRSLALSSVSAPRHDHLDSVKHTPYSQQQTLTLYQSSHRELGLVHGMANHPLPPRPHPLPRPPPPQSTSVPPSPGGLALPRTPYFSAPQPASPRPAGTPSSAFSPHRPSSPKVGAAVAGPGPASSSSASFVAPPEPVVAIRKALQKEGIKTNGDVLEFGHQWTVHWRAWRGAPLLSAAVSPGTNLNGGATGPAIAPGSLSRSHTETSSTLKYNPLAPFSSGATTPVHPLPRPPPAPPLATQDAAAKARSVFDEVIMGAHDAPSPVASTSTTGNATAPPLKDRLQSLQQVSVALDPVEQARAEVLREARAAELSGWVLSLFSLVKVSVVAASKPVEEGGKGKGKEKELEQDAAGRMLWVFSVTRGKSAKEGSDGKSSPASSARERLNALSFPDLTSEFFSGVVGACAALLTCFEPPSQALAAVTSHTATSTLPCTLPHQHHHLRQPQTHHHFSHHPRLFPHHPTLPPSPSRPISTPKSQPVRPHPSSPHLSKLSFPHLRKLSFFLSSRIGPRRITSPLVSTTRSCSSRLRPNLSGPADVA